MQLAGELAGLMHGEQLLVVLAAAVHFDFASGHNEEPCGSLPTVEEHVASSDGTGVTMTGQTADLRRRERWKHELALLG